MNELHTRTRVAVLSAAILGLFAGVAGCWRQAPERGWVMPGYDDRGTCFYPIPSTPVNGSWQIREMESCLSRDNTRGVLELVPLAGRSGGIGFAYMGGGAGRGVKIRLNEMTVLKGDDLKIRGLVDIDADGQREIAVGRSRYRCVSSGHPESLLVVHNLIVSGFRDSIAALCGRNDSLVVDAEWLFIDTKGNVLQTMGARPNTERIYQIRRGLGGHRAILAMDTSPWQAADFVYQQVLRSLSAGAEGPLAERPSYHLAEGTVTRRGVQAVDIDTGEELWFFPTASLPYLQAVCDLLGDSEAEILLGSYSPHNFVGASNMSDRGQAHVILLGCYGWPVWIHRVVGTYVGTRCAVGRLEKDREHSIVVAAGNGYADWGLMEVLDPVDGSVITRREDDYSYTSLVLADLVGDEAEEIVSGTSDGRFLVLDGNLAVLAEFAPAPPDTFFQMASCFASCANDIDGDGHVEIIGTWTRLHFDDLTRSKVLAGQHDSSQVLVTVLSEDLEPISHCRVRLPARGVIRAWDQPPVSPIRVCDVDGNRVNDIVTMYNRYLSVFTIAGRKQEG